MVRPLGIFFLSRLALIGAVAVARTFLILPSIRPDPACIFGICEPNGWVPLALAGLAMAAAVALLWLFVRREDGADAASSAVLLFLASPLSLVLALDAAAATAAALSLFALVLAARHTWAAGLALGGATLFTPAAAWMVPAVVLAAWAADLRGMRLNTLFAVAPVAVVAATGFVLTAPWLQVQGLTLVHGGDGAPIQYTVIGMATGICLLAFLTRRFVPGLAGAPWIAVGLTLGAPAAAQLGAMAVAPWGPTAVATRKWELEAPLAAALFTVQGLWLFQLVHGYRLT